MTDLIGKSLGRYHILESLGQGGMATVFKAFDTSLQRNVAIKIIRPDVEENDPSNFLKRFQREVRALAQLDHPYILKVLDYGEQEGIPYLVMPFVPGGTLKQKMGQPRAYQQAAALLAPIARALQYAHEQNIIHRDVKPANILISQSGAPLLSDFGIAKVIAGEGSTQLTSTGASIGTPDYMAPEQWLGVSNPGTDIYSLGVVFYEMVTGRKPYTADTPAAVMLKHMRDPLPRPASLIRGLPEAVEQVLLNALAKEPKYRFPNMSAFATALEKLARQDTSLLPGIPLDDGQATFVNPVPGQGQTRQAAPATVNAQASVPNHMNRYLVLGGVGLAALLLVCLLAVGLLFVMRTLQTNQPVTGSPAAQTTNRPNGNMTSVPATAQNQAFTPTPSPEMPTETATPRPPLTKIDGLPDDVPLITDNNGDLITSSSQGMEMYSFSTNLTVDAIANYYTTAMQKNGWKVINSTVQDNAKMWVFMKGDSRTVMISVSQLKNKTMISLMIPPIPTP